MALIIKTDGTIEIRTLKGTLEELQGLVGGMIQIVPIRYKGYTSLMCNEEGLLIDLPLNVVATTAVGDQVFGNMLVGDIVLMKEGEVE